jgi:hypothetical protein
MTILVSNDSLGRGIEQAGSALGQALGMRGQRQYQEQQRQRELSRLESEKEKERERAKTSASILQNTLAALGEDISPMALQGALNQAIAQGADPGMVNQMGTLYATLQKSQPKSPFGTKSKEELSDLFQKFGMDKQTADNNAQLYQVLTTGGQTDFAHMLIDRIQRNMVGGGVGNFGANEPNRPKADIEIDETQIDFPPQNPFEGLTPSEKVKRQSELYKTNTDRAQENQSDLKGLKQEALSVRQLRRLNDSGKLPTGLEKAIKINPKTGSLYLPAGTNEETQLFVKVINQFLNNAQKVFGGRVTNFELNQFKQGLPTLANSPEGRRLILEQMDIANQLGQLDADALKEVYERYGTRGIDPVEAQKIADRLVRKREGQLLERFDNVINAQQVYTHKQKLPPGHSLVEFQGMFYSVPDEEVDEAIAEGGIVR